MKSDIENSTHVFLPGVGSYSDVMEKIRQNLDINFLKKNFKR